LIGFFELSFMKRRQDLPVEELAQLMHDYLYGDADKKMGREFFAAKTPLTRSLAYEEHIPVDSRAETYERAREIVRAAGYGAVGMCYCRHKKEHLQQRCDKGAPIEEICISLGSAAKFMVRRGFAARRSTEELLAILDRARGLRLTHITDNIRNKPSFICNCCSCCCELLGGLQQGFPLGVAKTSYTLRADETTCKGCGLCAKACNVQALALVDGTNGREGKRLAILEDHCLGCGACIGACPSGSLSLVEVSGRPLPPANKKELFKEILKEKGRLLPYVRQEISKRLLRALGMG
jgi:ferredoxin